VPGKLDVEYFFISRLLIEPQREEGCALFHITCSRGQAPVIEVFNCVFYQKTFQFFRSDQLVNTPVERIRVFDFFSFFDFFDFFIYFSFISTFLILILILNRFIYVIAPPEPKYFKPPLFFHIGKRAVIHNIVCLLVIGSEKVRHGKIPLSSISIPQLPSTILQLLILLPNLFFFLLL